MDTQIWVPRQPTPLSSGTPNLDGIVGSLAGVKVTEGSHPLHVRESRALVLEGAHPLRTWAIYRR